MIARGAVLALGLAGSAAALPLDLPPGARLTAEEVEGPASHALLLGPLTDGNVPQRIVEGTVTRRAWQIAGSGTTLGLIAPLREALLAQGWTIALDCAGRQCGGFDFRLAAEVLPPPAMFVDLGQFHYLTAIRGAESLSLLASRSGTTTYLQAIHVAAAPAGAATAPDDPGPAPARPAPAAAGADLRDRLDRDGHAVLGGLRFASGSATLEEGAEDDLARLAEWLAADPGRRVAIVGHTDATGPLEPNIALSRARARAVLDRLASVHGVPRSRMEAHGMGWLAPVATNLTPEGRDANRRVEAVALP
ncbi:OmpA family protein [Rubellimicrobium sp. CFH 75288]|uniref:OmpA family protein n=1 Tax=Rubellimicrobium sp. CFH 75288 TaxID=2697034 RepID=UPI001411F72B|nr:OmpA family protein [Rubellimicrobium sp. CFH 75288]NAZ36717.1 OmpA family protein [Rubellimicrobium sp. CFH 75288]